MRLFPAIWVLNFVALTTAFDASAQNNKAEKLSTEVYRLPVASLTEISFCLPLSDEKSSALPHDPFSVTQQRPESDHRLTLQQRMEREGIEFPKDGYALLDWDHRALIVRTSEGGHQVVTFWLENLMDQQPVSIHLQTHSLELPAARLPTLLSAMRDPQQAASTLNHLISETTHPGSDVHLRQCSVLEMKSGQRSKLVSGLTSRQTQELTVNDKGVVQVVSADRSIGWTFECDPVLSYDARIIDLTFARTLTFPPITPLAPRPLGPRFSWPEQDLKSQTANTSLTVAPGVPLLAGHESLRDDSSRIHAFFLTAHSLRIQPALPPLPANFNANATPQDQLTRTFTLPTPWPPPAPWEEKTTPEAHLREKGIELPFASVIQPLKNNQLRVTTTREAMTLVEEWVRSEYKALAHSLTCTLEVFQVPAATAFPLLKQAPASSNHHSLLARLRTLVSKNQAQRTGYARVEAKSGQRATIETAQQRQRIDKLAWHPAMKPEIETQWTNSGLRLEMDPILGADGVTIELACQLQRKTSPPVQRLDEHQHPALESPFRLPYDSQPGQTLTSNHTLLDGESRLIAAWNPVGNEGALHSDSLELVFLSADVTLHIPSLHQATTATNLPMDAFPDDPNGVGMEMQVFHVPPDFLMSSSSSAESPQLKTAKAILEEHGIQFPEGSAVVHRSGTNELIVRNLPKWLEQIESYVCSFCYDPPRTLHCDAHIFELEASDLFALDKKHATHPDASALLDALLQSADNGTARLVDSFSLLSRSGHRSHCENVLETPVFKRLKISPQGHAQPSHEALFAGTRFEIDPILHGDGQTLDLTFALEHPLSPPQTRLVNLAAPGQPPLEVPLTEHGQAKLQSSLTTIAGETRVLAIWRPADAPGTAPNDRLRIALLKSHRSQ